MGEVYLAEDPTLRRQVAIKVLAEEVARDPDRRQRFVREAVAASALTHPHAAVVYEAGDTADARHHAQRTTDAGSIWLATASTGTTIAY